jgi:hypothetical protein
MDNVVPFKKKLHVEDDDGARTWGPMARRNGNPPPRVKRSEFHHGSGEHLDHVTSDFTENLGK